MLYGNNIIQQACKARSNLCKLDVANIEKQSPDLFFLSSQIVPFLTRYVHSPSWAECLPLS